MQRRYLGLTAAVAALGMSVTLAACGGDSGPEDVTLKLVAADYDLTGGDTTKQYWAKLTDAYEKKNPGIKIDVQILPWTDVDAKVKAMVEAGDAPDIAQIGAYADYAAADKLYKVDDLLSIPVQANFLAPLADAGEMRRAQYGMPFVASTRLLFYNKALFEKAGIDAPGSWEEVVSGAEKLKGKGVKTPFALPLGPEEAQAETLMWLLSNDGGYMDATGTYTIDSTQNVETFEWLQKNLVGKKLTGPVAPSKLNRKQAFAAFAAGEVGMLNGHPSLLKEAAKNKIEVGKVAMPTADGDPKSTMGVADWIMGFKEKGHEKQIGHFLDFVFEDENVLAFAGQNDLLPVTASASRQMEQDPEHKDLKEFLEALPNSQLPPVGKTSWARVQELVKRDIGRTVEPGGDPRTVLQGIARAATTAENAE
ncbi:extracellular solute-binding protein [Streptomyces sp. NPDC050504]|uniref:extracellular solute-binding protein n=1 Tax=Streptomyces sp. NPDC050504 TaxID=3365618 RepID=UPI0037ABB3C8